MIFSIIIQSLYTTIEIGLFADHDCVDVVTLDKMVLHAQIILAIDRILSNHVLSLTSLSFIAVNQGPAPFTTLRILLTIMNGIAFASHIPLVGIDGLHALLLENKEPDTVTIGLLNAFNNELYYGVCVSGEIIETGYKNSDSLLENLKQYVGEDKKVQFVGHGVEGVKDRITQLWNTMHVIVNPLPHYPSLCYVAHTALVQWHAQSYKKVLLPLYLKRHAAEL